MDDLMKIQVRDLNVFAGKNHILKDVNIDIPKNKITVIMGPSGCGKTTLLKCLNRLTDLYPELKVSGRIMIDDNNILDAREIFTSCASRWGFFHSVPIRYR